LLSTLFVHNFTGRILDLAAITEQMEQRDQKRDQRLEEALAKLDLAGLFLVLCISRLHGSRVVFAPILCEHQRLGTYVLLGRKSSASYEQVFQRYSKQIVERDLAAILETSVLEDLPLPDAPDVFGSPGEGWNETVLQQHSRKVFEAIGRRASSDWTEVGKKRPQTLLVGDYVVHDTHKFAYLEDLAPDFIVTKNGRGLSSFNAVLLVELQVCDEKFM
jgi:hypothetical protein